MVNVHGRPPRLKYVRTRSYVIARAIFTATAVSVLLLGVTFCGAVPASVPSTALSSTGDGANLLPSGAVNGQVSFRTKTRHGVRGMLPKPPKLPRLWGKKGEEEGLDTAKRFLHVTVDALVLEVEGEEECLSISRGTQSAAGGARVSVVRKADAGIDGKSPGFVTTMPVDGLFGVYDMLSGPFVAVVRRSKLRYANRELGMEFRQVSKVRLIPILAAPRALNEKEAREEARLLALLSLAFRSHQFYFSHAHDVTHTLQRLGVSASPRGRKARKAAEARMDKRTKRRPQRLAAVKSKASRASPRASRGDDIGSENPNNDRKAPKVLETPENDQKQRRSRRGWHGGPKPNASDSSDSAKNPLKEAANDKKSATLTAASTSPPPSDSRFFWNLGVLGPLLELREKVIAQDADPSITPARDSEDNRRRHELAEAPTFKKSDFVEENMESDGIRSIITGVTPVDGPKAVAAIDRWLSPVMSGFLQIERGCRVGEKGFDVLFVSRRSRLRQGTRFTRRGIDDNGNVANFVETEQSLIHEDKSVTSHVQIRGSIPIFWSSPTNLRYHPKVRIGPDEEASLRALRQHSLDLISLYGTRGGGILFVNLVDKKKEQGTLGETFDFALKAVAEGAGQKRAVSSGDNKPGVNEEKAQDETTIPAEGIEQALAKEGGGSGGAKTGRGRVQKVGGWMRSVGGGEKVGMRYGADAESGERLDLADSLHHVWFDFHHECRNMHWENLDKLLSIVDREFSDQGFYHAGPDGATLSVQDGVVRTNCMDCLDRTNVVQSLLARRSMLVQLQAVGVDVPDPDSGNSTALALTLDMLEMPAEELERRFRDLWGNNADEISMLYAGTPALKGDFTRTGQRTKLGLLQDGTNSAIRYVVNNFQDHRRQEAVDLLLGVHRRAVDSDGNPLPETIKEPLDLDQWVHNATRFLAEDADINHDDEMTRQTAKKAAAAAAAASSSTNPQGTQISFSQSSFKASLSAMSSVANMGEIVNDNNSEGEDVLSVGLEDDSLDNQSDNDDTKDRRRGGGRSARRQGTSDGVSKKGAGGGKGLEIGGDGVGGGAGAVIESGRIGPGAVVEKVTGAALAELRMAGPYSALALTALTLMAARGGGLLALGIGGSGNGLVRAESLALVVGLAAIPLVLSMLEER